MGYVIMYGDSPAEYSSAFRYYRRGAGVDSDPTLSSEEMTADDTDEDESED